MAFFNEFPHTRTYDNDLGWIIKTIKALEENLQNFIKLNTVKYADPIQWDISNQYESNTVVIDALTGVAYISTQPVPSGVNINNTDYWTPVFTLDLVNLNKNITLRNDGDNHNATFTSVVGDWIIVGGQLYRVTQDIGLHTAYVVGFNIEIYTVELFVKDYLNQVLTLIGDLQELTTSDKTSIVNAINSVLSDLNTKIGDLQELTTSDKTSIVNAINSVSSDLNTKIGNLQELNTEDKTSVVNAINEVLATSPELPEMIYVTPEEYGAVGDGVTDDTQAITNALNSGKPVICRHATYKATTLNLNGSQSLFGYKPLVGATKIICDGINVYGKFNIIKYINIDSGNRDLANLTGTGLSCLRTAESSSFYENVFEKLTISYFNNGIMEDAVSWQNTYRNIRINFCNVGYSKTSNHYSFNNIFEDFYCSGIRQHNLRLNSCMYTFINCNFGFSTAGDNIYLTGNTSAIFENCNFECDKHIDTSGTFIAITNGALKFVNCSFSISAELTNFLFSGGVAVRSIIIENCQYLETSFGGVGNNLKYIFPNTVSGMASIYGAIRFINSPSFPKVVNSTYRVNYAAYPYFYIDELGGISAYDDSTIDLTKLVEGQKIYFYASNLKKYKYYNGTALVDM